MTPVTFYESPRTQKFGFEVGDMVEVFCDHEKGGQKIRGWLKGIVVQVNSKMVAVQFRSNVFPDRWLDGAGSYFVVSGEFCNIRVPIKPTSQSSEKIDYLSVINDQMDLSAISKGISHP